MSLGLAYHCAQNLYTLWLESPQSLVMDTKCSFARYAPDDPVEFTESAQLVVERILVVSS